MLEIHAIIPALISLVLSPLQLHPSEILHNGTAIIIHRGATVHEYYPLEDRWHSIPLRSGITALESDTTGAYWAATKRGVARYRNNSWSILPAGNEDGNPLPDDAIRAVLSGAGTMPPLTGIRGGLLYHDNSSGGWQPFPPSPFTVPPVTALYRSAGGTVFIGTEQGAYTANGNRTGIAPALQGLKGSYIKSFFSACDRSVCCISYDYGQNRVDRMRGYFNHFDGRAWQSMPFKGIYTDMSPAGNGIRILTRTETSSYIYSLKDRLPASPPDSVPFQATAYANVRRDSAYIGTDKGLFLYTPAGTGPVRALRGLRILACDSTGGTWWCLASEAYRRLTPYRLTDTGWRRSDAEFPCNEILVSERIAGRTWLGTDAGILITDGSVWEHIPFLHPAVSQEITGISGTRDTVWVGTRKGLALLAGAGRKFYYNSGLKTAAVRNIGVSGDGTVWADASGWHILRNNAWIRLNETFSYAPSGETMDRLYTDTDGTTWLYSPDHGRINRCNGTDTVVRYESGRNVIETAATPLPPSPLWAANENGTWLVDNSRWDLSLYGTDHNWYEFKYAPRRLETDEAGTIWFIDCSALYAISGRNIKKYGLPPDLQPQGLAAVPSLGIWSSTATALMQLQGNRFRVIPLPDTRGNGTEYAWLPLPTDEYIRSISISGTTIHAGSPGGMFTVTPDNRVTTALTRPVRCVGTGSDGTAWGADDHGLTGFRPGRAPERITIHQGLVSNITTGICRGYDGSTWFLSLLGVSILTGKKWTTLTQFGPVTMPYICCATAGPDGMVLGSHKGLLTFNGKEWHVSGTEAGLPSDTVYAVATDHAGRIWAGTPGGTVLLENGTVSKRYSKLTCEPGSSLIHTPGGAVWLLRKNRYGRGKLYRFDGTAWKTPYPKRPVTSIAFSADGTTLYAGTAGGCYILPQPR